MPGPAPSNSGDVTPKAASSLLPSFLAEDFAGSAARLSTPPPAESPLPGTPKPRRAAHPPRTPSARANVSFEESDVDEEMGASMLRAGMAIARPGSACSSYSCSSDSSVDSNTTHTTADGSCTSIEDDDGGRGPVDETPKRKHGRVTAGLPMPERQTVAEGSGDGGAGRAGRKRKTKWTEAMDAHLWRTYALYQQDPRRTPFFVLPGQVPPLGVCYKVARETKKSWKDAKLRGDFATPRPRTRQRTPVPQGETSNRSDAMRTSVPHTWPASESATRRRLRELCRENYGPAAKNPYHHHHQQRHTAGVDTKARPSSGFQAPAPRDAFPTTRNMALSLATSTASSMRPTGALASLAAGRDVHMPTRPGFQFGGIAERIAGASSSTAPDETPRKVPSTPSFEISSAFALNKTAGGSNIKRDRSPVRRHHRHLSLDSNTPSLLPPLELESSWSLYGTWPRRLKRAEDEETEPAAVPQPPRTRPRRKTLVDLFGDEKPSPTVAAAAAAATAAAPTRTRTRGYTVSAGTNPLGPRRRPTTALRPSAPLLTVTPVSYDGDLGSPTTMRDVQFEGELGMGAGPRRLGSPFVERGRD